MSSDKRIRAGSRKYYWMRLKTDFFDQPEIKKLRRLAGGDTYTIIYLKMMLKTLSNNGLLIYQGIEDTFEKEVALIIDEDENNVMMTISYLRSHNLLEEGYSENEFLLNAVPELIGSETMDAQRKRIARLKDSEVVAEIETEKDVADNVRKLSADVRICPTEIEQSTEEQEKEIEKEQRTEQTDRSVSSDSEDLAWAVTRSMDAKQYAAFYTLFEKMKNGEIKTSKDNLYRYFDKLSKRGWKDNNGKPIRDLVKYVEMNFALNNRRLSDEGGLN
ncbi:MAG: phage replisome organizer N-terminal domain-containing protein [Erysipelotrichaceae bacterium]|nr:phage replisome organizer N-terminal domain-containing protein [Erysipelotrichaceae bacterium]